MSEQISKELKEKAFQRMTSPWFFTFIPWWVVFNYDFLLFATGNGDIVREMASHYCTKELYSTLEHFTIFGCAKPHTTFWWLLWFRFLLPILATVVSMTAITKMISYFNEKFSYYSLSLYERQTKYEQEMKVIDGYVERLSEVISQFKKFHEIKRQQYIEIYGGNFDKIPDEIITHFYDENHDEVAKVKKVMDDFMFVRKYLFAMQNNSVRSIIYKCYKKFLSLFKRKQKTK